MRPRANESLNEGWIPGFALQRLTQRDAVKCDTKAGLVEAVRDGLKPIGGVWNSSVHGPSRRYLQTERTIILRT